MFYSLKTGHIESLAVTNQKNPDRPLCDYTICRN